MILTLLNGTGYVFDVDDFMELRSKYRIVGALVGTASSKGWSASEAGKRLPNLFPSLEYYLAKENVFYTYIALPVELTKCETQLLIEQGVALLVSKAAGLTAHPSPSHAQAYKRNFEAALLAQADALKAEKLRETERHVDKILSGKRNKLLKLGNSAAAAALTSNDVLQQIAGNFVFDRDNALVEVPCAHALDHSAQRCSTAVYDIKSLKYRVFYDLWQRGKFVTCGDAFGADFLVYPGDPLLYHASHIVVVQAEPTIKPLELIAKVRLSVIVNKQCVFAYESAEGDSETAGKIAYQTFSWCNPSR
ncbi:hypothetical protein KR222_011853 [Zaprionus bogoriensis]|nr:hypothetical protein KR222_011853 [Zaprionus bogoriensis]